MNFWEVNSLALIAFASIVIAFAVVYSVFSKPSKSKR